MGPFLALNIERLRVPAQFDELRAPDICIIAEMHLHKNEAFAACINGYLTASEDYSWGTWAKGGTRSAKSVAAFLFWRGRVWSVQLLTLFCTLGSLLAITEQRFTSTTLIVGFDRNRNTLHTLLT